MNAGFTIYFGVRVPLNLVVEKNKTLLKNLNIDIYENVFYGHIIFLVVMEL